MRTVSLGWNGRWMYEGGREGRVIRFVRLCVSLNFSICMRAWMNGLHKRFLELHQIVSCHRLSQRLNADWWVLDSEVITWLDKILQEVPSNPENQQENTTGRPNGNEWQGMELIGGISLHFLPWCHSFMAQVRPVETQMHLMVYLCTCTSVAVFFWSVKLCLNKVSHIRPPTICTHRGGFDPNFECLSLINTLSLFKHTLNTKSDILFLRATHGVLTFIQMVYLYFT